MSSINTAAKRLAETDVKAIFSSVANNEQPPGRLAFKIIRVPAKGHRLSPPSFEFDDGIYVLLRSPKGNRLAPIPSELKDAVLSDSELASFGQLNWSLSGPQYPKRAHQKVQQRYCYPKLSRGGYSDKGGAMWTRLDSKGSEDIDCRIFHVYRSNKRSGAVAASKQASAVATRQSKRKSGGGGKGANKKSKVVAPTTSESDPHSSLLRGDLLEIDSSQMSLEFDNNLDFASNLFDAKGAAINQSSSFSFVPVPSTVASNSFDSLLQNNPAFNSAAARPPAAASQHPYYHYGYPPHAYGYGHGYYGSWARAGPQIPELTTSAEKESSVSSVQDFSRRLQDMEASINADVRGSNSTDQVLKLHLLAQWAKEIAQRPLQAEDAALEEASPTKEVAQEPAQPAKAPALETLQPLNAPALEPAQDSKAKAHDSSQDQKAPPLEDKIKMESPPTMVQEV